MTKFYLIPLTCLSFGLTCCQTTPSNYVYDGLAYNNHINYSVEDTLQPEPCEESGWVVPVDDDSIDDELERQQAITREMAAELSEQKGITEKYREELDVLREINSVFRVDRTSDSVLP